MQVNVIISRGKRGGPVPLLRAEHYGQFTVTERNCLYVGIRPLVIVLYAVR